MTPASMNEAKRRPEPGLRFLTPLGCIGIVLQQRSPRGKVLAALTCTVEPCSELHVREQSDWHQCGRCHTHSSVRARKRSATPQTTSFDPPAAPARAERNGLAEAAMQAGERAWGVDWSGSERDAGAKVWRACVDPLTGRIEQVCRPYRGMGAREVVHSMLDWFKTVSLGTVAFDFPFGLPLQVQRSLWNVVSTDARAFSKKISVEFASALHLKRAADALGCQGEKRVTDEAHDAPYAPLFQHMFRQTYWGLRLLSTLPGDVAILPWEAHKRAAVQIAEACPASTLMAMGIYEEGYKNRGGRTVRERILGNFLSVTGWHAEEPIWSTVAADREGDALDAIVAAHAALSAKCADSQVLIADPCTAAEGHIFT